MQNVRPKKIISAGLICLDITPVFRNAPVDRIDALLKPGTVVETAAADIHTGGSVANTGLAMKLLGADVVLMGKIGKDDFGAILKNQLAEYISTEHMIEVEGENTSYSVILAPNGIDRMFLHCPGANNTFSAEDPDYGVIEGADLFHFGYPPHMRAMFRNHGDELVRMFAKVDALGVATSLDMAVVDEHAESGGVDWTEILKRTLPHVDFFVPSAEELAFMIDRPLYRRWENAATGRDPTEVLKVEEIENLAETLLSWGAKIVLIKCGKRGLYVAGGEAEPLARLGDKLRINLAGWRGVRHFEKSYRPEKVLSGTGAGDTAIAAFLYAVMEGYSWKECAQLAAAEGACCVERYDAISGLRTLKELQERIANGWEKQA